jgi:hypothetical protein
VACVGAAGSLPRCRRDRNDNDDDDDDDDDDDNDDDDDDNDDDDDDDDDNTCVVKPPLLCPQALLVIPAALGYGDRGAYSTTPPCVIPPGADLEFEMELIGINDVGASSGGWFSGYGWWCQIL